MSSMRMIMHLPRIHLPLTYPPGSPDLGRHYRSNSPLPSIQLQAQSPSASQKHQAVQELPAANTFVGTGGDDNSTGSDQYSDYSYKTNQPKYSTKTVLIFISDFICVML
uniref:Protocadherin domain-containing protein n=1 Tax=Cyprinus carpio TaxID=7962 RepID=A0A8C2FH30_CYPCA